jgi:hypothetical protein
MGEPLSIEAVLVACPVCKAWPMVVINPKIMVLAIDGNLRLSKMPILEKVPPIYKTSAW